MRGMLLTNDETEAERYRKVIEQLRADTNGRLADLTKLVASETGKKLLKQIVDKIDAEGYVHLPKGPGMGYEIEWDYINDNLIEPNATTKKTHW